MARKRLGEILIDHGSIDNDQLMEALKYQKSHNGRLGGILVYLKYCEPKDVVKAVIEQLESMELTSLKDYVVDTSVIPLVPYEFSKENSLIPIEKDGNIVLVAATQELKKDQIDFLSRTTGYQIKEIHFSEEMIREAIKEYYYPLLVKKKTDNDTSRMLIIISSLVIILLFLVCNYRENIRAIISESKNKPAKRVIIEEINPLEMIGSEQESITELSEFLSEVQENSKDEIMTISGGQYRKIKDIRKVLFFHFDELFRYYNRKLRRNPSLSGKVVFEITIHWTGNINKIEIISTTIGDRKFINGARAIIKKWKFDEIKEKEDVKVRFPFDFNLKR